MDLRIASATTIQYFAHCVLQWENQLMLQYDSLVQHPVFAKPLIKKQSGDCAAEAFENAK